MSNIVNITGGVAVTMTAEQARLSGFDVIAVLAVVSADLMRSDKTNCAERYDAFKKADQMAMLLAHSLRDDHPFVYRAIQDARMLSTLSCAHWTRDGVKRKGCDATVMTYIAASQGSGLIKIGKSIDPKQRMASLQAGAAEVPQLLLVINEDIERALHKRFQRLRVFGEWFKDDGSIAKYIKDQEAARTAA